MAAGGALGALLRWGLGEGLPQGSGFPWTTFAINVSGSLALALLPALGWVRRRPLVTAALGPGFLGGYTTLSAYSEESRVLLAHGHLALAGLYVLGTLAACVGAVALASRLSSPGELASFETSGGTG